MNSSNYRFTLDIQSRQSQVSLPVLLNDTGRRLYISLTDGGEAYTIADGCRAVFVAKKSDGNTLFNDCIIEGNANIRYDFTPNTASAPGVVNCEVRLYGSDGRLITSPRFIMVVDTRVVYDGDVVISESESNALDIIITTEVARVEAEKARVSAEEERVEAERARATASEEAVSNVNKAAERVTELADDIEKAMDGLPIPIVDESDNGKYLRVKNGSWQADDEPPIPAVTAEDNGKFLRVVDGLWAVDTVPSAEGESY